MKIDHVAINVADLEAARKFFEEYLGGKSNQMYHNPLTGLRTYFITFDGGGDNGCRLELMNRPGLEGGAPRHGGGCGLVHLSFSVGSREGVDRLTKQLAEAGYEILDGPRTTGDGYYESSVRGFEGNILEITE